MITDLLKKYSLMTITVLLGLYGLYLSWFLFNDIYQPLFINPTTLSESNKYIIPDAQIDFVIKSIEHKKEHRVDVSQVKNPFYVHNNVVENITVLPKNADDLGLGVPQ